MEDAEYVRTLKAHLAAHRQDDLKAPAGTWGDPPRNYDHILPREKYELNMVAAIRDHFWREHKLRAWKLHQYFHHLSSSQAFAFNVFFPVYPDLPSTFRATRCLLGIVEDACNIDFEVEFQNGDGTNIDVLLTEQSGRRTVLEVKLTEGSFGRARHDERHVQKLRRLYRPLLTGRLPAPLLEERPFFRDYQLFRNLAQLRCQSDDRLILVLPRARKKLWKFANDWCARTDLGEFCGAANVVAIEDLIEALQNDARRAVTYPQAFDEIAHKYLPPLANTR